MRFTAFEVIVLDDDGSKLFDSARRNDIPKGTYLSREKAEAAASKIGGAVVDEITDDWHPQYPFKDKQELITEWRAELAEIMTKHPDDYHINQRYNQVMGKLEGLGSFLESA